MNYSLILKAILYRATSASVTFLIALGILQKWELAMVIGIIDTVFKIFFYYSFDVLWYKVIKHKYKPCVLWLTGLSGAGKTTIANELSKRIQLRGGKVIILDGDEIRNAFNNIGFDKESRIKHNINVGYMASLLEKQGYIVIVSLVSPFVEGRDKSREICNRFKEIYISTSLKTCEMRDVKGLYAKARKGDIKEFTGISSAYEVPLNPELTLDTTIQHLDTCVKKIISII